MSSMTGSVRMVKSNGCNLSESGSTRSTRFRFLSWSPETYGIKEYLSSFPLPRVVRLTNCDEANLLKTLVLPADVDITQPLLFYKKYRPSKVLAKCLKIQKSGKWKESVSVVIPDSFPGWFTVLNQEGKECAMTLTSMGQVAAARVPAFLTKFDVPVYKLTDSNEPGNKSVYVKSNMRAGSVLRLLGVWADLGGANKGYSIPQKSSSNFLSGSLGAFGGRLVSRSLSLQNSQPQHFQYVQCLSLDNEVLFIPFSATGVFYPIAPRGGRNPQHIYPLSAISRTHRLPIRAKMVYGALPPNLPDFTGTLQIERVDTEDVVLACTLMRDKPILFEIDLDCDLHLSQMTSEDLFIQSTGYQSALTFCRTEADNWRRQIRPYLFGNKAGKGGTVTGAYLLSVKDKNKSLRIRSSPPPPSKLSLLFRPSSAPFGSNKDPLRRSKSFNVEIQSVSISLTQDEEEEETKKLSTLFNFMAGKKNKSKHQPLQLPREKEKELIHHEKLNSSQDSLQIDLNQQHHQHQQRNHHHPHNHVLSQQNNLQSYNNNNQSVPDVLSNHKNNVSHINLHKPLLSRSHRHVLSVHCNSTNSSSGSSNSVGNSSSSYGHRSLSISPIHSSTSNSSSTGGSPDVPYGTVIDEVPEEENIYAEISDALTLKLNLNPIHQMGLNFHQLHRQQNSSNMSSLFKGGGGSDGAFSGTLSGTFSSSNPSNREEDIYDAVF